jgi:single-stranded DNA-binding protein
MISILASGALINKPIKRVSQGSGREFVTAQLRASGDGESFVVSAIAFNETVCSALLALDKGDDVSVVGPGKPTTWTGKDGTPAVGLSIVAQQLMTQYRLREKRKAVDGNKDSYLPAQSPLLGAVDEDGSAPF